MVMQTPTIVKQTKDYMLVKIPLPKKGVFEPKPQKTKIGPMEKKLWRIIQEGEKEYREGKTIRAKSIDEAIKMYERKKNKYDRVRN